MARLGSILKSKIARLFQKGRTNERGNTAITFAFALVPILGFVGLAVDGGRVFLVKSQLSSAVDVTALTATRLFSDKARDAKAKEFFAVNFVADKEGGIKLNPIDIKASTAGLSRTVTVTASAVVPTLFMKVLGIPTVTVTEVAAAARTDYPIELVMALDNTGSMGLDIGGGVSRLKALKTAATLLVDSIYGSTEDDTKIQIGIIPYTAYVNVGKLLEPGFVQPVPGYTDRPVTDALAWKGCVDADATNTAASDDMTSAAWDTAWDTLDSRVGAPLKPSLFPAFKIKYIEEIPGGSWTNKGETCEAGPIITSCDKNETITTRKCVEGTCYTKVTPNPSFNTCVDKPCKVKPPSSGTRDKTYPERDIAGHQYATGGNDALFGRANPFPAGLRMDSPRHKDYRYVVSPVDEPAWHAPLTYPSRLTNRQAGFAQLIEPTSDNNDNEYEGINGDQKKDGAAASPNTYCPQQALPLASHTKTSLKTYINSELRAFYPDWGTLSNQGLVWAWRMISPAPPLRAQAAGPTTSKAVVLMTDGQIYHPGGRDGDGLRKHDVIRTPYGFGSEKTLVNDANASKPQLINALNNRLKKTCQNMRSAGIEIYTITLDPGMKEADRTIYRECASSPSNYFDTPDADSLNAAFNAIADNLSGVRLVQ
jgi:Flp pilus assembly protein TadG